MGSTTDAGASSKTVRWRRIFATCVLHAAGVDNADDPLPVLVVVPPQSVRLRQTLSVLGRAGPHALVYVLLYTLVGPHGGQEDHTQQRQR